MKFPNAAKGVKKIFNAEIIFMTALPRPSGAVTPCLFITEVRK